VEIKRGRLSKKSRKTKPEREFTWIQLFRGIQVKELGQYHPNISMIFSAPPPPPRREARSLSTTSVGKKNGAKKTKKKLSVSTSSPPKASGRRTSSAYTAMQSVKSKLKSHGSRETPAKLTRQRTVPTTKTEKKLTAGKETRLAAMAVLRKLIQTTRPNVGAIVTIDELELLEKTVRTAANLDSVKSFDKEGGGGFDALRNDRDIDGSGLDDAVFNTLKAYMTVQVEKPKDKFKRAVRSLGGMKALVGKLKAGAAALEKEVEAEEEEKLEVDKLPDYVEAGLDRWR
jgi:hypothetical protein